MLVARAGDQGVVLTLPHLLELDGGERDFAFKIQIVTKLWLDADDGTTAFLEEQVEKVGTIH